MRIRAATRGSDLALWQTRRVASMLATSRPDVEVEIVVVSTEGDRDKTSTISSLAGRGVFAKEVQTAVLDGRADIAVHSAKDLTSTTPDGLVLGAFPERASVEDGLVGSTLAELKDGATIATGSVRRRAQLAHARPDLRFVELRGNMNTRLARANDADVDAIVVAAAGLVRLGLAHEIDEILSTDIMLPQVAQGALAVECRHDDLRVLRAVGDIDDAALRPLVETERAWLQELGSGCDLPVGGLARWLGSEIQLEVV
ncbi:MAG: hydroxymethylbilane synthase, partial [Actinobacteria bacterium]|nr:hydroxymethylbilane synthase [Actinomycetota bacterium]